jgi:pentatricopeptide repeat protein
MSTAAAVARTRDPTVALRLGHPALVLLERCGGGARPFKAILAHMLRLGLAFQTFPMSRLLYFTHFGLLLFHHFTPRPNLYTRNLALAALSPTSTTRSVALYRSILASPAGPDERTFLALLRSVQHPSLGKQVHAHVLLTGLHSRVYLRNSLLKMYLDAGDVDTAEAMLRCAPVQLDTVSCNVMLSGYARGGFSVKALRLFRDMALSGIVLDQYAAVALLSWCGRLKNALLGRSVHGAVARRMDVAETGLILSNALLDMYAKCGEMSAAMGVFGETGRRMTFRGTP